MNHLAHLADAFCAPGLALIAYEDVARTLSARLDGEGDVTLAKAIAIADVQGGTRTGLIIIRYSSFSSECKSFA